MGELKKKHCVPCEGGIPKMERKEAETMLTQIPNWALNEDATGISRDFKFKNYYKTISFVNALAWIAHQEDHHPDIEVGYNHCKVHYSTHAVGGLSTNDFICAAKVNELIND